MTGVGPPQADRLRDPRQRAIAGRAMRLRRPSGVTLAIAGSVVVIAYLLLAPLVVQLASSLRGPFLPLGVPGTRWSLIAYRQLYTVGGGLLATVRATALYVGGATMLSVSLG